MSFWFGSAFLFLNPPFLIQSVKSNNIAVVPRFVTVAILPFSEVWIQQQEMLMTLHFKYVCVLGKAVLPVDKRI